MSSWDKVKIVADEGTEFGVIYDSKGELAIVVKHPGKDWPHNLKPTSNHNKIDKQNKAYIVITDAVAKLMAYTQQLGKK